MSDRLDWAEQSDFENARSGLIDQLDPCVVRDAGGRVVWDNEQWGFLDGNCPDTVHPSLWRQAQLTRIHGLFEVAVGVYQVRGLDASNMTIVEGETGVIVIDPLVSAECAAAALALYRRNCGDRPVRAVIYTHSHGDHFGGVHGVTSQEDVAAGRCAIVAPADFMHHAVSENLVAGPAMLRRAQYMYGRTLPPGPAGSVGFGLAQALSTGSFGLIPPTVSIDATGQELTLDGIRFVFQLTPDTEAPAEMNFYLPDGGVLLIAENVNHSLHNVLTLRGALVRDARAWADYITQGIGLFGGAEVLIGSHTWPTWGRAEVVRILTEQRDAYAYIHDQTVRLMNRGLTGTEIAESLAEFPGALGAAWSVRGYYGSISHNVKAVYQRYMGWYDAHPGHLWQLPPVEAARRYVEFMGGADAVVAMARKCYADGDLRWVAEVLTHVVFACPEHHDARLLQAQAFEDLGYTQENATWRNIYLTGARELRQAGDPAAGAGPTGSRRFTASADLIAGLSTAQLFGAMAVRLDGPRAAGRLLVMRWELSDTGETWTLLVRNGVLTATPGPSPSGEEPQLTIGLTRAGLEQILTGRAGLAAEPTAGTLGLVGDAAVLTTFLGLLELPPDSFPIVTR